MSHRAVVFDRRALSNWTGVYTGRMPVGSHCPAVVAALEKAGPKPAHASPKAANSDFSYGVVGCLGAVEFPEDPTNTMACGMLEQTSVPKSVRSEVSAQLLLQPSTRSRSVAEPMSGNLARIARRRSGWGLDLDFFGGEICSLSMLVMLERNLRLFTFTMSTRRNRRQQMNS